MQMYKPIPWFKELTQSAGSLHALLQGFYFFHTYADHDFEHISEPNHHVKDYIKGSGTGCLTKEVY